MKIKKQLIIIVGAFLYVSALYVGELSRNYLEVVFLDVGQGDAILITTPEKVRILIDGGGGNVVSERLGEFVPVWIRRIDIVILTHAHADHIQGLLGIIEQYEVKEVWFYPVEYRSPDYEYWLETVRERLNSGQLKVRIVYRGMIFDFGKLQLKILWPLKPNNIENRGTRDTDFKNLPGFDDNINNDSIVFLASFGEIDALFMGDAELEVEEILVRLGIVKREIDILKAGHHCSRTATGEAFLGYLDVKVAICSLGKDNRFGHPHLETVERLEVEGARIYRTDEYGSLRFEIYDNSLVIR
jgi:competence protein ComEC